MTFALTSLFMFLVFWRPQEWLVPGMFGWPVLDVVVILAILSLMAEISEGRTKVPTHLPQVWLLLGLWLSAPISHIPHTYVYGFVNSIIPVFKICFFTFLMIVAADRPSRIRQAALLFVGMGITMTVHAILQQTRGYGFAGAEAFWVPSIDGEPEYWRSMFFGIFADPNDLAQFLITCMPFAFVLVRQMPFVNFVLGLLISYYLYQGLIATDSRGGMVGFAASIGMQVLLWLPRRWFPYLFAIGILAFLGACPFMGGVLDASAHDRVVFWGLANKQFLHNPVFGLGYEMFWMVTQKGNALHNAYVACYTDLGFFGYWFWFGLIYLGFAGSVRAFFALKGVKNEEAKWLRSLARQILVASFGFCASAYFLSRTFLYPLFFLMAMMAVVPLIARRYLPPDHPPFFPKRKRIFWDVTVASIISIIYIYISCILLNKAFYG